MYSSWKVESQGRFIPVWKLLGEENKIMWGMWCKLQGVLLTFLVSWASLSSSPLSKILHSEKLREKAQPFGQSWGPWGQAAIWNHDF